MFKITVHCPLCAGEAQWIYDPDADKLHRGIMGCPGGCTSVQSISVSEIPEEDALDFLSEKRHPENNLNL